jgi:hypothetical protein
VKNDDINQDWITDKTRFCLDSLENVSYTDAVSMKTNFLLLTSLIPFFSSGIDKNTFQFFLGPQINLEDSFCISTVASRFSMAPVIHSSVPKAGSFDCNDGMQFSTPLCETE